MGFALVLTERRLRRRRLLGPLPDHRRGSDALGGALRARLDSPNGQAQQQLSHRLAGARDHLLHGASPLRSASVLTPTDNLRKLFLPFLLLPAILDYGPTLVHD